ncbi:MAG: glycoside hydrolase [Bacteroidota bacterium]
MYKHSTLFLKFLFIGVLLSSCKAQVEKINGVSFVAARDTIDQANVSPVAKLGANYAAIMPFGFIKNLQHPEIIHNTDRQWFGEIRAGAKQYIEQLRKLDIKIMVKPQIWVWRGEFTGDIEMNNEADWKALESSYNDFIMTYAELAAEVNAEIFCIGTELENFVEGRPAFWMNLISEIKKVYPGKLTYAANWDEYKRTPFWAEVDYIGVDAYFPVSEMKTPTVEDCRKGWQKHKTLLQSMSKEKERPILFTEFGYRSMDYNGSKPWNSDHTIETLNFEAQSNATQALFEEFWNQEWFSGGFIWKWFVNYEEVGGMQDNQFTPQNKPVEDIITSYYKSQ